MTEEIWKDAKYLSKENILIDFDGWYQVSNKGRVRSFRKRTGGNGVPDQRIEVPFILKSKNDKGGYIRVSLKKDGKIKGYLLHRLILTTFKEVLEHLVNEKIIDINHIDEDKQNNNLENLEWCSRLENNTHGTRTERAIKNSVKTRTSKEWKENNPNYIHPNARKVIGVNIITGKVIELDSMNCADEYFGIPLAGRSISASIRGRQKTAYGYKWFYKEDYKKVC